ncbi:MAG: ABC transporter substrate-binding protein, partial [Actinomycetota bacterium]
APWDDTTRRIGLALGRSDEAEELIEGVQDKFAAARQAHPEFEGKTAMLVGISDGTIYARGPKEPHGKVFAELGFGYPEQVEALIPSDNVLAELSLEQIELLESDVLMVGEFDTAGELTSHPLYLNLPAVREGRVVPGTEPIEGALYWASVASLPFAIDQLVPQLAAAADGNPGTTAVSGG